MEINISQDKLIAITLFCILLTIWFLMEEVYTIRKELYERGIK